VRSGKSVGFIQSQDFPKDLIFYMNDLPQGMDLPLPKTSETVSFQVARRKNDAEQLVAVCVKVVDVGSMMNSIMQLKMKDVDPVEKRSIEFNVDFLGLNPAAVINDTNDDFDIEFRPLEVEPRTLEETMTIASKILHSTKRDLRENNRGPRDRIEFRRLVEDGIFIHACYHLDVLHYGIQVSYRWDVYKATDGWSCFG